MNLSWTLISLLIYISQKVLAIDNKLLFPFHQFFKNDYVRGIFFRIKTMRI